MPDPAGLPDRSPDLAGGPPPAGLPSIDVGGQAVVEGVMMRSPRSFAVVCRRPSGEIVIREEAWQPIWRGVRVLRWPFLRGGIVLLESLWNGISALTFAADQQAQEAAPPPARSLGAAAAPAPGLSTMARVGLLAISISFGLALFVGAPHLLAWAAGSALGFGTDTVRFHVVDGAFKMIILVGYLAAISLLPDIRRVFQYHGAEHKAIRTYELKRALTVEEARAQSRFHPRCGTSFLLIVILVSVVLFALLLRGRIAEPAALDHLVKILVKIPLMFPVAGLAYEAIKLSGRHYERSRLARALAAPGLWLQQITTREPDDGQLEIALISIRKTLWRERQGETAAPGGHVEVFASAAEIDLPAL